MAGENGSSIRIEDLIQSGDLLINDGYRAKNAELSSAGLPFARAGNINSGFHFDGEDCIPLKDLKKVGFKISQPGDVVFTSKGTVGRFALVRDSTPRFVYAPQLCFWRSCNRDLIDPQWLYYWMHGREFYLQYKGVAGQTDMAEYVSLRDQRKMGITIPPLPDQRAIANILGSLDDKIELNRRMNETLEGIARALFKSWFVDFDPVRAKMDGRQPAGMSPEIAELFPSELEHQNGTLNPTGWSHVELGDLCTVARGSSPRPIHDFMGGTVPWVKIADATRAEGPFIYETKEFIKEEGVRKSVPMKAGELILSNSATCGVPMFLALDGCIHDGWLFFKGVSRITKHYLYFVLMDLASHLIQIADGTVQKNLNTKLVASQKILVPPAKTISAFSSIAEPIFSAIYNNGLESRTLATLRDTLLPKLLSGEIRVPEAEQLVEEAL